MSKNEKVDTRVIIRGISFLPPLDETTERNPSARRMVVVTDVEELQSMADAGKVDLKRLYEAGAITGDWDNQPEAA